MTKIIFTLSVLTTMLFLPSPNPAPEYYWAKLNGAWVMTHYGLGDGNIGRHHGAYWNGLQCPDANDPDKPMPDHVTGYHLGLAMPGPEFYCVPIKVCFEGQCIIGTSMDVMADYRIRHDELYFSHIDIWPEMARRFKILDRGIIWGESIEVYVGAR